MRGAEKTASRAAGALLVALSLSSGAALAQEASTGIAADRLRPALGPTTLGSTEGADTTPSGRLSILLALGYLRDPVVLRTSDGAIVSRPVRGQLTGVFGFEVGLPRRFALRASIPVAFVNDGDRLRGTAVGVGNDGGQPLVSAAGDLQVGAKVSLVGAPSRPGFHGALALDASFPLGGEHQFAATDGPTVAPRVLLDYRLPWITFVLDVQVRFARERQLFSTRFADELILSGGAIARIVSLGPARRWHLLGYVEGQGAIGPEAGSRPGELRAALRLSREAGLDLDVGGGGGLVDAVGAPRWRLFVLFRVPLFGGR